MVGGILYATLPMCADIRRPDCAASLLPFSRMHGASCRATCVLIAFLIAAADVDIVVAPVFLHLTEVQKTLKAPFKVGCQALCQAD